MIKNTYQEYNDRDERNRFIVVKLGTYLGDSILNIGGGGKKHLKKYLPEDKKYIEIDIDGNPDIKCDLEEDLPLDIDDNSFNSVIATEVLEHIDNHIEVLEEMIRVSKKHVILSLPNNWAILKFEFFKKSGSSGKFYGFPSYKPVDRHKWFFNAREAESFYREIAKKYNLEIVELFHIGYTHKSFIKNLFRVFVGKLIGDNVRKNLFSTSVWCVLRKIEENNDN